MITEKLQNAINEQITAEMWSSNLYLAMSFYMEKEGYCGMASWLKKQSFEEHAHACELASYIIKRGGKAKLDKVDVVPNDFGTPLEVFEQVYEHECRVSKMIDALVDVAAAEKDKASQDFLWGFVREQVEEEATAAGIVDMVKKAGAAGIVFIDAKLGERKFPVMLVKDNGLKSSELKLVESVIEENQEVIAEHWNKFFNKAR